MTESVADDFGRDPNVRGMRRVFALMETRQAVLLAAAGISPWDERLRYCRDRGRLLFEKAWAGAAQRGVELKEEDLASLYVCCLAHMLRGRGISVPEDAVLPSEAASRLLRQVLP
jgi:hypothetical protein